MARKKTTISRKKVAGEGSSRSPPGRRSPSPPPPHSPETPRPILLPGHQARYNLVIACNTRKVERRIDFDDLTVLKLKELFSACGMDALVAIWDTSYTEQWVASFVAHLKHDPSSDVFSTTVEGVAIDFRTAELCARLDLPTEGINPYLSCSENDVAYEDALREVLGDRARDPLKKRLYRNEFPPRQQVLSYIMHFNIMPRGGRAQDEVPSYHLQFMYALLTRRRINFAAIFKEVFLLLAAEYPRVIMYHRFISWICGFSRVPTRSGWSSCWGEMLDNKKLKSMRLGELVGAIQDPNDEAPQQAHDLPSSGATEDTISMEERLYKRLSAHQQSLNDRLFAHQQSIRIELLDQEERHHAELMCTMQRQHEAQMAMWAQHFPPAPLAPNGHAGPTGATALGSPPPQSTPVIRSYTRQTPRRTCGLNTLSFPPPRSGE